MEAARRYLVAYDSPSDPRRNRIAKALELFGDRVQYSVFIVDVRPARLVRLRSLLESVMDDQADSILIADLGPVATVDHRRFEFIGRHRDPLGQGPVVL